MRIKQNLCNRDTFTVTLTSGTCHFGESIMMLFQFRDINSRIFFTWLNLLCW